MYRATQLVQVLLACNKLFSKYHAPADVKLCAAHSNCVLNLPCIIIHVYNNQKYQNRLTMHIATCQYPGTVFDDHQSSDACTHFMHTSLN